MVRAGRRQGGGEVVSDTGWRKVEGADGGYVRDAMMDGDLVTFSIRFVVDEAQGECTVVAARGEEFVGARDAATLDEAKAFVDQLIQYGAAGK